MITRILLALILTVSLTMAGNADAGTYKPNGTVCQGSTCDEGEGDGDGGSTTINNNNKANANAKANATGVGVGIGVGIGKGGNATVNNKVSLKNQTKVNTNVRNNNLNLNVAKGGDGGDASSSSVSNATGGKATARGGNAKQNQSQSAVNEGNTNSITIEGDTTNVEADKREHITGPGLLGGNATTKDAKASNIRAKGDLFSRVSALTFKMAKRASKNASDMNVEEALLYENDFRTDYIRIGASGDFVGYIYIFADGDDCYLAAMDAEAAEKAMLAGFTHIRRLGEVETSKFLEGSAWNIGISGGASIMSANEDLAIAPQGGLGYGKAKSVNQYRPDAVYEVFFDADVIRNSARKQTHKKQTGNHTSHGSRYSDR